MSEMRRTRPSTLSRRDFLHGAGATTGLSAALVLPSKVEACELPVMDSIDGEHRTIMHFLNTIMPGNEGQPLFQGDLYPLRSGGDHTAGAWSACALDVFYDPYYGMAGLRSSILASALDWAVRSRGYATFFYEASQWQQIETVDSVLGLAVVGARFRDAADLGMTATLGAAKTQSVTQVIGWGGSNGGYYSLARHPLESWRQPTRLTQDGSLP